jgi:uncharacterized membrane protein
LKTGLRLMKSQAKRYGKIFHVVQFLMGLVTLYIFTAIIVYLPQHQPEITLANAILLGTLLVTILTSFANVKRRDWLSIELETAENTDSQLLRQRKIAVPTI